MNKGSCLCGAVRFEVSGALSAPCACHCSQCRKQSGHYWASTEVKRDLVTLCGDGNIGWYAASDKARRGFCTTCGSFLFWDAAGKDTIALAMGAFEAPTDTHLNLHIFTADKGDYYDIADGLPQNEQ